MNEELTYIDIQEKKKKINKVVNEDFDTSVFWNPKLTLTHNCLFNIIVGNRGGGKSFGFKEYVIDKFINTGEQFGYIRRYKEDLVKPMKEFFKDIAYKYPEYEFKVDQGMFWIRLNPHNPKEKWTEKDIAGYGFILSTANNKKSIPYPNVTTLGYDEFLLDKGNQRYLNDEPLALLNLYETVARPGTPHPRVVLFMMANAITITNPYFLFWNLKMPDTQDKNGKWIWKAKGKSILVEDVRNEKFIDMKKNTEFGQIIDGTKYAEYSINNEFLLDSDEFVEKKDGNARYYFTFVYKGSEYGVWINVTLGLMYVSKDVDPTFPYRYSLTMKDHSPNTMFFKSKSRAIKFKTFLENYRLGNVRFESINIKNICYEVIQMSMSI